MNLPKKFIIPQYEGHIIFTKKNKKYYYRQFNYETFKTIVTYNFVREMCIANPFVANIVKEALFTEEMEDILSSEDQK